MVATIVDNERKSHIVNWKLLIIPLAHRLLQRRNLLE